MKSDDLPKLRPGDYVFVGSCFPDYATAYGRVLAVSGKNARIQNLTVSQKETWNIYDLYPASRAEIWIKLLKNSWPNWWTNTRYNLIQRPIDAIRYSRLGYLVRDLKQKLKRKKPKPYSKWEWYNE